MKAPRNQSLEQLLAEVRACSHCAAVLPHGPRPVLQAGPAARLRIVGQAPGRKVHASGIPWADASGERLREWMGVEPPTFYDASRVAIVPMGFCYPGRGPSGDLPPRPECAGRWHARLEAQLPRLGLTLLIGTYAHRHYLGRRRRSTLSATVRDWADYLPDGLFPLPHPSPRNQPWMVRNPWFAAEVLPALREAVREVLALRRESAS